MPRVIERGKVSDLKVEQMQIQKFRKSFSSVHSYRGSATIRARKHWTAVSAQLTTNTNTKGSHPSPDPQFFWTLFKKPLTPRPPPFVLNIMLQIFLMDFLKSA